MRFDQVSVCIWPIGCAVIIGEDKEQWFQKLVEAAFIDVEMAEAVFF